MKNMEEVEDLANKTRAAYKKSSITNNTSLVRYVLQMTGGRISRDDNDAVGLHIEDSDHYRIKLSPYDSQIRDNVFIMINIGHVMMHISDAKPGHYHEVMGTTEYKEALRFALAFLLPKDEVVALKGKQNLQVIAAMYHIPTDYTESRLRYIWDGVNINMKRYRCIKEVYAEPKKFDEEMQAIMPKSQANIGDDGYKVVYDDGYVSWSPKEVFEKGYVEISK